MSQTPTRRSRPRSMRGMSRSAPAWCRSPATTCRCSIPTGILDRAQLDPRARPGLFDVSHMGQAFLVGPDHETTAARARGAGPRRHPRPQARPAALLAAAQRGGRHPRRPDGDALARSRRGRRALCSSSTPRCKDDDFAHHRGAAAGQREADPRRATAALLALQGPEAAEVLAALAPGRRRDGLHGPRAPMKVGGIDVPISRSGYTGEDGYEISVDGRQAGELWDALLLDEPASSRSASARAIRCGSRPGLCLYGHDIDTTTSPVEAGADLVDPEAPARGGRLSRREPHPARARRGPGAACASACCRKAGAGPRRRRDRRRPRARSSARSPRAASAPTLERPRRHGLCRRGAFARPARALDLIVRGKPLPADVAPMPFVPQPLQALITRTALRRDIMAETRYTKDHEYIRVEGDIGTVGITDYAQDAARRRRVRRAARRRQDASPRAARPPWSRASRPRARSMPRSPARWSRSTARSTARPAPSTRIRPARAGSSRSSSPTPPSSTA